MEKPMTGGSYIRHPKSGKLKLQNVTKETDPATKQPVQAKPPASNEETK